MRPDFPLFYTFHFYLFGLIALASALLFVTRKSPVAAALWLVNVMFSLAALYVLMDAQFVGAIQVLVYAGAIMVVFLFVIMLLNLGHADAMQDRRGLGVRLTAGLVALALLAEIGALTRPNWIPAMSQQLILRPPTTDAIGPIAGPLFGQYLLAFELTSVLILAAIVGAVVLGPEESMIPESLALSAVLFVIGVMGVLTRRNALILFMCIELMLNAVNLSFVAFSRLYGVTGQVFVIFVMTVAAAEAAVGLAIVIAVFRHRQSVDLDDLRLLRG